MCQTNNTLLPSIKIDFIKNIVESLNNVRSSIAEVGVYRGGSAKTIADNKNKNDKLFLFDTFEGIPNISEYDNFHKIGDFNDVTFNEIINLFREYENVYIFKGTFPEETSKFIIYENFKFVHLDVDTYPSYKASLDFFYDRMIKGGYIIFDDYGISTCEGATKAVNEFFSDKKERIIKNNESYYIIKE